MRIWIIDHYSVPVKYYPLARNTNFAKIMQKLGHEVVIFAASTVHKSELNLVRKQEVYKEVMEDGVKYVLIYCHSYKGNGVRRILNMVGFAAKLEKVCDKYPRPDVIISQSMTLQACKKGIQIGKKYGCKTVAEITDLWPETLVAYGKFSKGNPAVLLLRRTEKWIYVHADRVVFSMEGAYDYIVEQGWERMIPKSKVLYINNGINLAQFDYNREHFQVDDADLNDGLIFKVVYVGSVRMVNNLSLLVDVAKKLRDDSIRLLIWGDGDDLEALQKKVQTEKLKNIIFKGRVDKRYIPYITSKADINILHSNTSPIWRFGLSLNKLFDYLAAGKPILVDFHGDHNPAVASQAAVESKSSESSDIAQAIELLASMDSRQRSVLGKNARKCAENYDFNILTKRLLDAVESIHEK